MKMQAFRCRRFVRSESLRSGFKLLVRLAGEIFKGKERMEENN